MARPRWDRPDVFDHRLLLADPDDSHRDLVVPRLEAVPGREREGEGRHPRFQVIVAADGEEALARATAELGIAAVDLVLPRVAGLDVVQVLRARFPDLALLAFSTVAPASEAVAAVMAGADHFLEWRADSDADELLRAVEIALERRRLTRLIEHKEADVQAARGQLAELTGALERAAALARPLGPEDVLPFDEAARRYLAGAARAFEGDPHGLAERLGVSYFALRRLLARYGVPVPRRPRGGRR